MAALSLLFRIILILVVIKVIALGVYALLNRRDAKSEEASYRQDFDHRKGISRQSIPRAVPEEPDPEIALKKYRIPDSPIEGKKATKKSTPSDTGQ